MNNEISPIKKQISNKNDEIKNLNTELQNEYNKNYEKFSELSIITEQLIHLELLNKRYDLDLLGRQIFLLSIFRLEKLLNLRLKIG